MRLSDAQIERYSRQIILRELGGTGQTRLLAGRCLVAGGGDAAATALSYLAGAGVGAIDLLAGARVATLPLAALAARSPDTALRALSATTELDPRGYDVVLRFEEGAATDAVALPMAAAPRLGAVSVRAASDGALLVLLVPRVAGCLACVAAEDGALDAQAAAVAAPAAPVALAAAGTLAALACVRWLGGVAEDRAARLLASSRGSALWCEGAPRRRSPCPRGCPPATERL